MKDFFLILTTIMITCVVWYGLNTRIENLTQEKKVLEKDILVDGTIDIDFLKSLSER